MGRRNRMLWRRKVNNTQSRRPSVGETVHTAMRYIRRRLHHPRGEELIDQEWHYTDRSGRVRG
eukprot:8292540-Pyramimonas_sp.AAC.1